jgi:hypothetical protein
MAEESSRLKSITTESLQTCIEEAINKLVQESYKAKISKIDYTKTEAKINRDVVINQAARSKALIPTPTGCCRWC